MAEPGINFQTFTNQVNAKLDSLNMSAKGKAYVQGKLDSIFDLADGNQDKVLHKNEMSYALEWLNMSLNKAAQMTDTKPEQQNPDQNQQITDPRFQGLENYGFKKHGAKDGIGEITINGEKVLIDRNNNQCQIHRLASDGKNFETLEFSSIEELKKAIQNKEMNWGRTEGAGCNDVFIP